MNSNFQDIRNLEFLPLSEVKARLSGLLRKLGGKFQRIAITTNGRPSAVILEYQDYLDLLDKVEPQQTRSSGRTYSLEDWKKQKKQRAKVRDSILNLFNPEKLSRKGQKKYKQETVDEFA